MSDMLAESLAEERPLTDEELDAALHDVAELPSVPAEDPAIDDDASGPAEAVKLDFPPLSTATYYTSNLNTILQVVGNGNNKADKQQYVLKAMDISLQLTAWDLARLGRPLQ